MMNINYKRLFNLNIGHDYFIDGFDRFVNISPTIETQNIFKNGKMLFKRLPHGVTALYLATDDETTPFVMLDENQSFVFYLTSENISDLLNITDLDESALRPYSSGSILYFTNDPANPSSNASNPEILTHEIIDSIRPQLFTYTFSLTGNPATAQFQVSDSNGDLISVGTESDGTPLPTTLLLSIDPNNGFSQQLDFRDKLTGRYKITILDSTGTSTLKEEEIYVDEYLSSKNILGIVELVYNSTTANIYDETEEYKLQFQRAETFWRYFIVNKSNNINYEVETLQISDFGTTNGTPYIINQFERSYAGIQLTADATGVGGNLISLDYSGAGLNAALILSGQTLSGGSTGVAATGTLTLINNAITGYTISINGIDFIEGTHFNHGLTPEDSATELIAAINASAGLNVIASLLGHDTLINNQKTVVFSSSQAIPFYEKTKAGIQLITTSDSQKIISNLPNPAHNGNRKQFAGNPESEVFVFI